jgi:hypothetical protein
MPKRSINLAFTDASYPCRMVDIASQLAADFMHNWSCICIAPQSTSSTVLRPPSTTVTIGTVRDRSEPGVRIWLSRAHADKTVAAFFSRDQRARRKPRSESLIVEADVAGVDHAVRNIASSLGYVVAGDEFIDGQLSLVTTRISAAIAGPMKRDMKKLRREYKNEREGGATLPRFDAWLCARMRPALQAGLG